MDYTTNKTRSPSEKQINYILFLLRQQGYRTTVTDMRLKESFGAPYDLYAPIKVESWLKSMSTYSAHCLIQTIKDRQAQIKYPNVDRWTRKRLMELA